MKEKEYSGGKENETPATSEDYTDVIKFCSDQRLALDTWLIPLAGPDKA